MRVQADTKADQDKKLFVGGLNHKTDEASLREYYSQWGDITDVVVMKDPRTGTSRGFGFVTFGESSSVDAAQNSRPHHLDGKQIDSKRAMPREETSPEVHAAVKKIFVGALKKEITNDDLHDHFSQYGKVLDAQVVFSKERNESRGFGFVTFDDTDAVDKVILARPHTIRESKADVRKALSKEEMGKLRTRPSRQEQSSNWSNGSYSNTNWDSSYGQGYGMQNYGYNSTGYGTGYNYESAPPQQTWGSPPPTDGNFGAYQQSYGGGPMRGGQQYSRSAPYSGSNWQR